MQRAKQPPNGELRGDAGGPSPERSARVVVLVEDDPHISMLVRFALESDSIRVEAFDQGVHGLQRILDSARPPDMVILDVMLPDSDGLEILTSIRGDAQRAGLPVLVASALNGESQVQRRAEGLGAAFLPKPFDVDALHSTVQAMLAGDAA